MHFPGRQVLLEYRRVLRGMWYRRMPAKHTNVVQVFWAAVILYEVALGRQHRNRDARA
jgi:hypothetical protein